MAKGRAARIGVLLALVVLALGLFPSAAAAAPPTITFGVAPRPLSGSLFGVGQTNVFADFVCDRGDGFAAESCEGDVELPDHLTHVAVHYGDPLPTSDVGDYTVTVTLTDPLGDASAVEVYEVTDNADAIDLQLAIDTPSQASGAPPFSRTQFVPAGFSCTYDDDLSIPSSEPVAYEPCHMAVFEAANPLHQAVLTYGEGVLTDVVGAYDILVIAGDLDSPFRELPGTYEVADIPALDLTVDPPPTGANGWYKGGDTVGMVATAQAPPSDPSTVGRVLVDVYALPTTSDATFATSPLTSHMIFSFQTSAETENGCEDSKSLDPAAIIAGLPDGRYGFFFTAARCDFGDNGAIEVHHPLQLVGHEQISEMGGGSG